MNERTAIDLHQILLPKYKKIAQSIRDSEHVSQRELH